MGFTKKSSEEAATRKEQQSGGMRKWSRFSLGCNTCNNYSRKHKGWQGSFHSGSHSDGELACVCSCYGPGIQFYSSVYPKHPLPLPSFPGTLRNSHLIQHATWVFFFLPVGAELLDKAVTAQKQDFRQLVQI